MQFKLLSMKHLEKKHLSTYLLKMLNKCYSSYHIEHKIFWYVFDYFLFRYIINFSIIQQMIKQQIIYHCWKNFVNITKTNTISIHIILNVLHIHSIILYEIYCCLLFSSTKMTSLFCLLQILTNLTKMLTKMLTKINIPISKYKINFWFYFYYICY